MLAHSAAGGGRGLAGGLNNKLMKVNINEIRKRCESFLVKTGVGKSEAKIIVDDYVEGELLGKKTHGLLAFVGGVYDTQKIKRHSNRKKIKVIKDRGVYAMINGGKQKGQLVAEKAVELVIKKAKKYGIAMVGTFNSGSILRPGSQAEKIAQKNLIGLIFHNGGGPLVPPYGGIDPIISTDPIGYAIPTLKQPIVADFAVSERAWGEIRIAKELKHALPMSCFLNMKGQVTTDPNDAFSALPFGGYKGFCVGLLSEILTGALVGNEQGLTNQKISVRGALYMAIDPSKFVNLQKFKKENSRLISELKKSRRLSGVKEILLPGERAFKHKALCLKRGWFDVDKKIVDKLNNLFKQANV